MRVEQRIRDLRPVKRHIYIINGYPNLLSISVSLLLLPPAVSLQATFCAYRFSPPPSPARRSRPGWCRACATDMLRRDSHGAISKCSSLILDTPSTLSSSSKYSWPSASAARCCSIQCSMSASTDLDDVGTREIVHRLGQATRPERRRKGTKRTGAWALARTCACGSEAEERMCACDT